MSKESDEAYKIAAEMIDVRFSPKHMWEAALSFADKQQAERDARIKDVIESADEGNAMWTIFRIRDIMEGK